MAQLTTDEFRSSKESAGPQAQSGGTAVSPGRVPATVPEKECPWVHSLVTLLVMGW